VLTITRTGFLVAILSTRERLSRAVPLLLKCKDCGHEYLFAFSCKRRHFCPSCHQKRVVEFGEWLCMDVLKKIPHRHFVFSIPKILRRYFLYDRKLLADLS
jgi:hypothetical protein